MIADSVIILVDCQKNFCDPGFNEKLATDEEAAQMVRTAVETGDSFLHRVRESARTPIVVQTLHPEVTVADTLEPTDQSSRPRPCIPGTEGASFADWLTVHDSDIVITKHRYSPFYATDLDVYLTANGVSEVLVGGVNTHICVLATVLDAVDRDYDVIVLSDCTAASSVEARRSGLSILESIATDVRPSRDITL